MFFLQRDVTLVGSVVVFLERCVAGLEFVEFRR